jgi:hypothetical protein
MPMDMQWVDQLALTIHQTYKNDLSFQDHSAKLGSEVLDTLFKYAREIAEQLNNQIPAAFQVATHKPQDNVFELFPNHLQQKALRFRLAPETGAVLMSLRDGGHPLWEHTLRAVGPRTAWILQRDGRPIAGTNPVQMLFEPALQHWFGVANPPTAN